MGTLKEINLFDDETGKMISSTVSRRKKLGGDWIVFYKKPLRALAEMGAPASVYQVYLYLASKQTYQNFVMCTPGALAQALCLTHRSIKTALKFLEDNRFLQTHNVEGNIGYLLNPEVTTKGIKGQKDKQLIWAAKQGGYWMDLTKGRVVNGETGEIHKLTNEN